MAGLVFTSRPKRSEISCLGTDIGGRLCGRLGGRVGGRVGGRSGLIIEWS